MIKYTFRLIKSTFNRFIAILAIVFIGVSFMMGLRGNYDIMKKSVEKYADETNFYDVQIYSNFGFDDNDVKAIKQLDYVDDVFASKTRDVYVKDKIGNIHVARVLEIDSNLNNISLNSGKMPTNDNECLIITGYTISEFENDDELSLYLEDEEINDIFKNSNLKIVGRAKSIEHMAETFSTSLLDNKDLNLVIYVPNNNFISEYYSCLYIKFDGSEQLNSFSKEYEDYIDANSKKLDEFSINQSQELRNSIIEDAIKEIEKGEKELEENRAKYQKDLDSVKKQLDDAWAQLEDAKKQIDEGELAIPSSRQELINGQKRIDEGYIELKEKEQVLNDGIAQLEKYGMTIDELDSRVNDIYSQYAKAENSLNENKEKLNNLKTEKQRAEDITSKSRFNNILEVSLVMSLTNKQRYPDEYARLQEIYDAFLFLQGYDERALVLNTQIVTMQNTLDIVNGLMKRIVTMSVPEGYAYIHGSIEQIRQGQVQISQAYIDLQAAQEQINNGCIQLNDGIKKLEDAKKLYEDGYKDYQTGLKEYQKGLDEFNSKMQDGEDEIEDAYKKLEDLQGVEWTLLSRYDTNYSFYAYKNNSEQMKSIGTIIPLLFFIVAALVCSTTMTRLIDEQRNQIGVYRALGFRNVEIVNIYLLYVIFASLFASVFAVFVGIYIFPTIIYTTWRLMYDLPSIIIFIPLDDLLICIFSFTSLMILVTYIVIKSSLRECPAQLLRPKAPKTTKQIILEKWKWMWNKLPFASKITARNLLRYKKRFIMTVIGVAGCTSLLLMGWGIKDSISSTVGYQYDRIFNYNYLVDLKDDRHIDQILNEINNDSNNEHAVPYLTYSTIVSKEDNKDEAITLVAIDSDNQEKAYILENYKNGKNVKLNDEGIIITDKFAKVNNIKVGDEITIESYNGTKAKVKVCDIVVNYVYHYIYISEEYYKQVFDEDIEYNKIAVRNINDSSELLKMPSKFRDVNGVSDFTNSKASFDEMISALNYIILIIIVVAGALAFVVLINLTNVNISERIREIATLKVLGFRHHEVNSYIFKEIILMTVIGAILGLPLGNIEERYIMSVIDMDMCKFPYVIKPISYVYAFGLTIVFALIVLVLTSRTLKRVKMVESLKSIE